MALLKRIERLEAEIYQQILEAPLSLHDKMHIEQHMLDVNTLNFVFNGGPGGGVKHTKDPAWVKQVSKLTKNLIKLVKEEIDKNTEHANYQSIMNDGDTRTRDEYGVLKINGSRGAMMHDEVTFVTEKWEKDAKGMNGIYVRPLSEENYQDTNYPHFIRYWYERRHVPTDPYWLYNQKNPGLIGKLKTLFGIKTNIVPKFYESECIVTQPMTWEEVRLWITASKPGPATLENVKIARELANQSFGNTWRADSLVCLTPTDLRVVSNDSGWDVTDSNKQTTKIYNREELLQMLLANAKTWRTEVLEQLLNAYKESRWYKQGEVYLFADLKTSIKVIENGWLVNDNNVISDVAKMVDLLLQKTK